MKRDFSSEIRMMKEKYSPLIINKTFWEGKSVAEFFSQYRETVTKFINSYLHSVDNFKLRYDKHFLVVYTIMIEHSAFINIIYQKIEQT